MGIGFFLFRIILVLAGWCFIQPVYFFSPAGFSFLALSEIIKQALLMQEKFHGTYEESNMPWVQLKREICSRPELRYIHHKMTGFAAPS